MHWFVCLFVIAINMVFHQTLIAETRLLDSQIESVRVYQGRARVTRLANVPPSAVDVTYRFTELPNSTPTDSVDCQPDDGVIVDSIRVLDSTNIQQEKLSPSVPPEVQLQDQAVEKASQSVAVIEQDLQTVENMVEFATIQVHGDVQRSRLDVSSVTELVDFVMKRRRALAEELLQARKTLSDAQSKRKRLLRDLKANAEEPSNLSTYDVLIATRAGDGGTVRMSYWVEDVFWSPKYTLRATSKSEQVTEFSLQLEGILIQDSGEDWDQVSLAFCTGLPDAETTAPPLLPFRVATQTEDGTNSVNSPGMELGSPFPSWRDPRQFQENLQKNTLAAGRQINELNRPQGIQRTLAVDSSDNVNSETYQIDTPISIDSRTEAHVITLLAIDMEHPIERVVTPLLSSFAYRQAELTNPLQKTLIGGDVTVILDGYHVGQSVLPPSPSQSKFVVGLGPDRQVRTRRELLSRSDTFQGGNRVSRFKYRLVVSNFHEVPIEIQLYDRLPTTDDTGAISVSLDSGSEQQLSSDAKYKRMQAPTGILRWDLTVPASRFGADAFDHEYEYVIETDRNHKIVDATPPHRQQEDLRFQGTGGGGMGGGMGGGGFGGGGMSGGFQ